MGDRNRFEPPTSTIGESARAMADAWTAVANSANDIAHAKRTIFLAYVAEGFSEAQALELVKSI